MSYRRDLKYLRRARQLARRQQQQLAALDLAGLTAATLHAHARPLTIPLERRTGSALVGRLCEALRNRRQALAAEARQVRHDWLGGERLDGRLKPPAPRP